MSCQLSPVSLGKGDRDERRGELSDVTGFSLENGQSLILTSELTTGLKTDSLQYFRKQVKILRLDKKF